MFTFEDIAFRPIDREDLELIRKMHNEISTLLQLGDVSLTSSSEQIAWWERMNNSKTDKQFCICHPNYDQVIGVWRLQHVDYNNRNCEVGLDIFPFYRRKGFGTKAYRMILCYLFEHYNMHTVYIRIGEFNEPALRLYKKIGFKETGKLIETIFRHGRYWDNILMCMTEDEYFRMFTEKEIKSV